MRSQSQFVREFFEKFASLKLQEGAITYRQFETIKHELADRRFVRSFSQQLFHSPGKSVRFQNGLYRLVKLSELDGAEFPMIQYIHVRKPGRTNRELQCFVGHRFLKPISTRLRTNLAIVFEPYRIRLNWGDRDVTTAPLFSKIVDQIKAADFCIFDNIGTLNKPNVYIEVGLSYMATTPSIFCEYKRSGKPQHPVPDAGVLPADLEGLLRLQYGSYRQLFEEIYFRLPGFLDQNGLM